MKAVTTIMLLVYLSILSSSVGAGSLQKYSGYGDDVDRSQKSKSIQQGNSDNQYNGEFSYENAVNIKWKLKKMDEDERNYKLDLYEEEFDRAINSESVKKAKFYLSIITEFR